jgi:hypothetical protein
MHTCYNTISSVIVYAGKNVVRPLMSALFNPMLTLNYINKTKLIFITLNMSNMKQAFCRKSIFIQRIHRTQPIF